MKGCIACVVAALCMFGSTSAQSTTYNLTLTGVHMPSHVSLAERQSTLDAHAQPATVCQVLNLYGALRRTLKISPSEGVLHMHAYAIYMST